MRTFKSTVPVEKKCRVGGNDYNNFRPTRQYLWSGFEGKFAVGGLMFADLADDKVCFRVFVDFVKRFATCRSCFCGGDIVFVKIKCVLTCGKQFCINYINTA